MSEPSDIADFSDSLAEFAGQANRLNRRRKVERLRKLYDGDIAGNLLVSEVAAVVRQEDFRSPLRVFREIGRIPPSPLIFGAHFDKADVVPVNNGISSSKLGLIGRFGKDRVGFR